MTALETINGRIAHLRADRALLDARLEELEQLRDVLEAQPASPEPATVPTAPAAATPRPARRTPATEKTAEKKPAASAEGGKLVTQLQKERAVAIARALAGGPIGFEALQKVVNMSPSALNVVLKVFGSPPKARVAAYFQKMGDGLRAPWGLTELGRRELLPGATPDAAAG